MPNDPGRDERTEVIEKPVKRGRGRPKKKRTLADYPLSYLTFMQEAFRLARHGGHLEGAMYTQKYVRQRWKACGCGKPCAADFSRWFTVTRPVDEQKAAELVRDFEAGLIDQKTYLRRYRTRIRRVVYVLNLKNYRQARERQRELEAFLDAGGPGMSKEMRDA